MRRRRLTIFQLEELTAYAYISPWLIGFLAFTAVPMLLSFYYSFTEADMLTSPTFVGLANYIKLFSTDEVDSLFWKTLYNTCFFTFLSVPLNMALGLAIALLLNQKIKGLGVYRTIYYLPAVVSGVAVSLLWIWIFNPNFGILNYVLSWFGIKGPAWLFSEEWAKPALIIMSLWGAGGGMLIFLAGLQGIPTQLYEAAELDGASSWVKFFRITLPIMSPTIFFVLVTDIIGSFQVFTASYVMTGGGPNNATKMYVLWLYNLAFQQFKMGYACSLAWVYLLIMLGFTLLIFKSSPAWVYYESEFLPGGKQK